MLRSFLYFLFLSFLFHFFFATPPSLSCMLTTTLLRIYRKIACRLTSTAVQYHHIHTRDRIRGQCRPHLRVHRWSRRDRVKSNIYSLSSLSVTTTPIYRRSRSLVRVPAHGYVGALLGMSPISGSVVWWDVIANDACQRK